MPRPSRKRERTDEILDAYGRCIAAHGVSGATLERVADEAGLARALIRHNVGNKDQLLAAFVDRFLRNSSRDSDLLFNSLPDENRLEAMTEWLFDPRYSDPHGVNVTTALFIEANENPQLGEALQQWTRDFVERLGRELRVVYPRADATKIHAVATGISAIYFNFEASAPLGKIGEYHEASKEAARLLISALAQSG